MTIIIRTIIGLFTGLVGGPIFGAVLLVAFCLPGYFSGNVFFDRAVTILAIAGFIGAELGLIAGPIIGFIVGVFGLRKLYAALTGIVVILIMADYLAGPPWTFQKLEVLLTVLAAVAAAALGSLISGIVYRFQSRRTLSDDSPRC